MAMNVDVNGYLNQFLGAAKDRMGNYQGDPRSIGNRMQTAMEGARGGMQQKAQEMKAQAQGMFGSMGDMGGQMNSKAETMRAKGESMRTEAEARTQRFQQRGENMASRAEARAQRFQDRAQQGQGMMGGFGEKVSQYAQQYGGQGGQAAGPKDPGGFMKDFVASMRGGEMGPKVQRSQPNRSSNSAQGDGYNGRSNQYAPSRQGNSSGANKPQPQSNSLEDFKRMLGGQGIGERSAYQGRM